MQSGCFLLSLCISEMRSRQDHAECFFPITLPHRCFAERSHAEQFLPAKPVQRQMPYRCLQSALGLYPLEVYLPQLTRSLDAVKAAKSRTALLEIFSANCGQAVTTAAALPALRYPYPPGCMPFLTKRQGGVEWKVSF